MMLRRMLSVFLAFSLSQYLSVDNELFNSWMSMSKDALGIDDATVVDILKAA